MFASPAALASSLADSRAGMNRFAIDDGASDILAVDDASGGVGDTATYKPLEGLGPSQGRLVLWRNAHPKEAVPADFGISAIDLNGEESARFHIMTASFQRWWNRTLHKPILRAGIYDAAGTYTDGVFDEPTYHAIVSATTSLVVPALPGTAPGGTGIPTGLPGDIVPGGKVVVPGTGGETVPLPPLPDPAPPDAPPGTGGGGGIGTSPAATSTTAGKVIGAVALVAGVAGLAGIALYVRSRKRRARRSHAGLARAHVSLRGRRRR